MMRKIIQKTYDTTIRDKLPKKITVHNGVAVRSGALFDSTDVKPDYEESLVAAMRERVSSGDDVVIVGGGRGVSAVVGSRQAGADGSVAVYEGAASQVEMIEETVSLNQATDAVSVNHAIVGDPRELWSDADGADRMAADELPACDVLVLDCEGSEVDIVPEADLPDIVIVETHGVFDAPTDETRSLLVERGYEIVADRTEIAEEDVHVLTALRK